MREEFLHYLWKYGLYDHEALFDDKGNKVTVINPGEYNRDSGPDFFNARVKIADVEWAGNVEIHSKASEFMQHGHHTNHAFDNVILHVVAENDNQVKNSLGMNIPATVLKYSPSLYDKYVELVNNPYTIACQLEIKNVDTFIVRQWLGTLAVERLMNKVAVINKMLESTLNDWDEVFYRLLARYFGFRVNTTQFEMLANALPYKIIRKHSDNHLQVEALLFGTAGMLDSRLFKDAIEDDYFRLLVREYKVLMAKYSLKPLHGWLWKFARIRPPNFPTLRISQLASLLTTSEGLFSKIVEIKDVKQLKLLFCASASSYWNNHYVFGKESGDSVKTIGSMAVDLLLINVVVPMVFAYGASRDNREVREQAVELLGLIKPEENMIIREWREVGVEADSALYTQALIELKNNYCKRRRCVECRVGSKLISLQKPFIANNGLALEPKIT